MSSIRYPSAARRPAHRLVCLAIASALAAGALPAFAATAPETAADAGMEPAGADRATRLDGIEVQGEKVDKPASPKYTEALIDTPQTITVINKATMDQQGLVGLRDILTTLPGITFGAGEGGGGYGDSINLRGFSANSDITVDGVRDSAQYTRTDNFNMESLELVNGANSVYSGAGSVGGNINLVSKAAHLEEFSVLTLGAGTDGYGRATFDTNHVLGNDVAFRMNAMVHQNDVPDRDYEDFKRFGIAPSIGFALDSSTRLTLSALYQQDENTPQYGLPYFSAYGGTLPGIDEEGYYGYNNLDRQDITNGSISAVFEHDFSDSVTLRSLARFQRVEQTTVVSAVQGTWCLASGINPATGLACPFISPGVRQPPNTYQPSGPRGSQRDTVNSLAISQTDLTSRFEAGGIEHALVVGVAFTKENFDLQTGNLLRNPDGSVVTLPRMDISNPDSTWTGPVNYILAGRTHGDLSNAAIYAFDTLKFSEQWMLSLGARFESNEGGTRAQGSTTSFDSKDNLFSYRAGLVYKPADNGTIYLSYSNSQTPSKASVNGSCTALNCNVDPESAVNIELGTKWDIIEGRLAVTGAIFRNDRENYKVADFDPITALPTEQALDGEARVDGVSLGIAGQITREWSIFANATFLDSEIIRNVSETCLATPGQNGCTNTPANPDPEAGLSIVQTPEKSASVWTTYTLAQDWTFGYGVTYQDRFRLAAANYAKGFITHRAMVGYTVNDMLSLQLNVNNLFDKDYFVRVRNNGWATPGEARSVMLTANVSF